jgi:transcriptional regulator with XRE-family HTH domain
MSQALADWSQRYGPGRFSVRTVARWEKGEALPSFDQLLVLALVLRVDSGKSDSNSTALNAEVSSLITEMWSAVRAAAKAFEQAEQHKPKRKPVAGPKGGMAT